MYMKQLKYLILAILLSLSAAEAQTTRIWDGTDIALVSPGKALLVDGSASTQPISGTVTCNAGTNLNTSALATSALQATGNTSLSSIDTKTPALGQAVMASSSPVVIASNQSSIPVAGDVAHDSADSGNPVKIGFKARTTLPAAVASADRVDAIADVFGKQIVQTNLRDQRKVQGTTITSSAAETIIITAGAVGVFNDLVSLTISNSSLTTGALCLIQDKNGGGGSVIFNVWVPSNSTVYPVSVAGSALAQGVAAWNWTATCTSVSSIYITAVYEQANT